MFDWVLNTLLVIITLNKKWSFLLRISSVNVTKSAVPCRFGHIYWRNPEWKTSFWGQKPFNCKSRRPGKRINSTLSQYFAYYVKEFRSFCHIKAILFKLLKIFSHLTKILVRWERNLSYEHNLLPWWIVLWDPNRKI